MKHIYILTTFLCLSFMNLNAQIDFTFGGIYYRTLYPTSPVAEVLGVIDTFSGDLIIPEQVVYFDFSTGLTTVKTVTGIKAEAFKGSNGIYSATIGNNVTSIGNEAFMDVLFLTSVIIGNSVTSIGERAFANDRFTSINIPNSVTLIGKSAFKDCELLTSVTIGNSVISIGEQAFRNCNVLTSVNIPNSVTSIGPYAFWKCSSIVSATIGNSLANINVGIFRGCTALTSVSLGNSLINIFDESFKDCTSLASIIIPDSVMEIGDEVFKNCTALTSINIPNAVNNIEPNAFENCTGLTAVTVNWQTPLGPPPPAGYDGLYSTAFAGITQANIPLYVPAGTVSAYQAAAVWQDFSPIQEQSTLSTTDFVLNKTLKAYPNPTTNFITISGLTQTEKYSIYNMLGVEVAKGTIANNNNIAVQHLTNGMYFLKFANNNTLQFIKE